MERRRDEGSGKGKNKNRMSKRGYSDRMYYYNFIAVHAIVGAVVALTALSGILGITDMSAMTAIASCAYAELGIHTGFIVWKAKAENCRKNKDYSRLEGLESEEL